MKYCSSCGQCLSDNCDFCPVCGHNGFDKENKSGNSYEPEKYVRSGVKYSYVKPKATITLIAINVLVFLVIRILNFNGSDLASILSMHRGAVTSGQVYRIVTSIFTHEDLFHLLSNCYALYVYGTLLEPAVGRIKYLLIYFVGGLLGNFLTFAFMKNPSIGASGAIFGLLGAIVAIYYINPTAMNRMMMRGVISCVIITTLYSFTGGINNLAHFGGLFGGYLMTCVCLTARSRKKLITSRKLTAIALLVVFALSTFIGISESKGIQKSDELQYGNYTYMCFLASFENYDDANEYAMEIISDGQSYYLMDAHMAQAVYGMEEGILNLVKNNLNDIAELNRLGYPVFDENIYNDFKVVFESIKTDG